MVDIKDTCYLMVGFGPLSDIVENVTPFNLRIHERIGNLLPTAEMTIVLPVDLMSYIATEHVPVYISIGFDKDVTMYSSWQINAFDQNEGQIRMLLTLDRSYINDCAYKSYYDQSVNVIKNVVNKYFSLIDMDKKSTIKMTNSSDRMKWLQCGDSMRDFVNQVWAHSWANQKLMMPAISAFKSESNRKAGTFKLLDLSDLKTFKTITRESVESQEDLEKKGFVWMAQSMNYKSNASLYNSNIGRRGFSKFDIDASVTQREISEPKPIFKGDFNAKTLGYSGDGKMSLQSDNLHGNFAKARAMNLTRLSRFSAYSKRIAVVDYGSISIGDIVNTVVPVHQSEEVDDIQSGVYVVAEVIQSVTTTGALKTYTKELVLRRDANTVKETKALFT